MQSVARALAVLEAFADSPGVFSLNELARHTGLDRSAVQRLAHTLIALGYLERGPGGKGYQLGKLVLDRCFDFLRGHPLIERATPILLELHKECAERVDLSLFDDLSIIYALRHQGKRLSFYSTLPGRRMPTWLTSGGRAIMAHLDDAIVDDILARSQFIPVTPKTLVDADAIREKIDEARRYRYSLSVEESLLGEIVLASAIVHEGLPVGAIHIAGSRADWEPDVFCRRFSPLAIAAAHALSV